MKNFICASVVIIMAFQTTAHAQNISLPADSVTKLLCKKWEMDYALVQGNRIDIPPSTPRAYVEFFKDGTFSMTMERSNNSEKGAWKYDSSNGKISMLIGKDRKEIISLTKDQFAIFSDDPASAPNDPQKVPLNTKVYFKVKR
ncbi:MAG: hypothetical protein JSU01_20585 [Bacteroidetes bacterium]|nr:hypothetical protein [Bacteroidota bacterium]